MTSLPPLQPNFGAYVQSLFGLYTSWPPVELETFSESEISSSSSSASSTATSSAHSSPPASPTLHPTVAVDAPSSPGPRPFVGFILLCHGQFSTDAKNPTPFALATVGDPSFLRSVYALRTADVGRWNPTIKAYEWVPFSTADFEFLPPLPKFISYFKLV